MSSKGKHADIVDECFEVRGISVVCNMIIDLPAKVRDYVLATKGAK